MTTFIFPNDLLVIENKQEIILRKGVLHKHEIIIDKEKSSSLFVKDFAQFMINKKIIIEENQEDNVTGNSYAAFTTRCGLWPNHFTIFCHSFPSLVTPL